MSEMEEDREDEKAGELPETGDAAETVGNDGAEAGEGEAEAAPESRPPHVPAEPDEPPAAPVEEMDAVGIPPEPQQREEPPQKEAPKYIFDPTKPRLMITKMVLRNFKSYQGEKVIGPFHKRFTSVVGPNGSGKSNVIDSLLFVFGKRASQMRFKKIGELVHNSTEHQDCKKASVTVHFQMIQDNYESETDYEVIPNSRFTVMRWCSKKNASGYKIDGVTVTWREVEARLATYGIDVNNNRFLILQGEVENIAMMKPKGLKEGEIGLLEYLEDLIGSGKHLEGIARANAKEEEFGQQEQEKLNRLKIVEKDRDKLKAAKDEAEGYIKCECEVNKTKAYISQKRRYDLEVEQDRNEKDSAEHISNLEKTIEAKKGVAEKLKAMEADWKAAQEDHHKLEAAKDVKKREVEKFEIEFTKLKEEKKALKKTKKKGLTSTQRLTKEIEEAEELIKSYNEELPRKIKRAEELVDLVKDKEIEKDAIMKELEVQIAPIKEEIQKKQKDLVPLMEKRDQFEIAMKSTDKEIAKRKKKNEKNKELFEIERGRAEQKERDLKHAVGCFEATKGNLSELKEQHLAAEQDLASKKQQLPGLREEIGRQRLKLQGLRNTKERAQGGRRLANALMEAQAKGKLSGVLGRIGDLGTIPDKYDCAISTAAGSRLDMILVEDIRTAKSVIDYLNQHQLGRANMLALDKQTNYGHHMQPKQFPENLPRLFDLIKPREERFAPAFYHVTRDTLVANEIDQADRVAFARNGGHQRFRVVTLEGSICDPSGSMSGGGKKQTGKMSSKPVETGITDEMLQTLDAEIREKIALESKSKKDCRELEKKLKTLQKSLQNQQHNIGRMETNVHELEKDLEQIRGRLPTLEKKSKQTKEQKDFLANLETDLAHATKYFNKQNNKCTVIQDDVARLQQQCMDMGGARLKICKDDLASMKAEKKECEERSEEIKIEAKNKENTIKRHRTKMEKNAAEVEEIDKRLEEIKVEREKVEQEGVRVMEEAKKLEEDAAEKIQQYNDLNDQVTKLEKEQKKLNKLERNINDKLSQYRDRQQEIERKLLHVRHEMKSLLADIRTGEKDLYGPPPEKTGMEVDGEEPEAEEEVDDQGEPIKRYTELPDEQIAALEKRTLKEQLERLENELKAMTPNMSAIEEYRTKDREYIHRLNDLNQVKELRQKNRDMLDDLKNRRQEQFMSAFREINRELKTMYRTLTVGGDAELSLVDRLDPFVEGVEFTVRPPKKSWKVISNLSGGEKTLSSMSLVFALHKFKPTPLYVMDEIDAALDFKNVSIVADYIKKCTKNAQFIIISLRNNMFEQANWLVGVYKTYNVSKSLTINPHAFPLPAPPTQTQQNGVRSTRNGPPMSTR